MVEGKKQRIRSPKHPYFPLKQCVEFAIKIHVEAKFTPIPSDMAMKYMGQKPTSSVAARSLSAMIEYGLLEEKGSLSEKRLWLSSLARQIIIDTREGSGQWLSAVRRAALLPGMMSLCWNLWKRQLPADSKIIETYLTEDNGFSESAAERFTTILRKNYAFAQLDNYIEGREPVVSTTEEEIKANEEYEEKSPSNQEVSILTLGGGKRVTLTAPNDLTDDEYNFMIRWIDQLKLKASDEEDIPF
jgi:hypothetical protein